MTRHFLAFSFCTAVAATAMAQPSEPQGYGPDAPTQRTDASQPPGDPAHPPGQPSNAMFAAIDADGDGVITMRELRKAVAALKSLDLDKDGKITLAEVMSAPAGPGGIGGPGAVGGRTGFGKGPGGFSGDPRSGVNLSQYDRNGDGALSPDEVPAQMMGLVRGSDQNRNGKLDPEEIEVIQQRMNERLRGQRALPPGVTIGPQGVERDTQR